MKNLHEQVACLVCECNAKDELMAEHLKTAQEAIAGDSCNFSLFHLYLISIFSSSFNLHELF